MLWLFSEQRRSMPDQENFWLLFDVEISDPEILLFHFCKAPFIQPSLPPSKRCELPWQSPSPWQCTTQQDIPVPARPQPTMRAPCGITGKQARRFCVCKHITVLIGLRLKGRIGGRRSQKSKQQENRMRKELRGKRKPAI